MLYSIVCVLVLVLALPPAPGIGAALQEADTAEPLTIPPEYDYDPRGRRDPFVNPLTPAEQEEEEVVDIPRPLGLPGVMLNEAELTAVVTSSDPALNVVVVHAPGDRVFIARTGDELLDAVIREIRSDIIVFEVKPQNGANPAALPEIVVRPLSARPGE